jgi:hypothetical protein
MQEAKCISFQSSSLFFLQLITLCNEKTELVEFCVLGFEIVDFFLLNDVNGFEWFCRIVYMYVY